MNVSALFLLDLNKRSFAFALCLGVLASLVGCAHRQANFTAPSSAVIDGSLTNAISTVSHAAQSLSHAQSNAVTLYKTFTNVVTNTALRQDFVDMQSAISDAEFQLSNTTTSLTTATNALFWYEQDDRDAHATIAKQDAVIQKKDASIAWWRSKALWGWGIIAAVLVGLVIYFGGPWLGKIAGAVVKTP